MTTGRLPTSAGPPDDALTGAYRTLIRATEFLGSGAREPLRLVVPSRRERARYQGNVLRELDRFLNLLLDACAPLLAPAVLDAPAFARLDNAAHKLALIGDAGGDRHRLRAIGRLRACLHHCAGRVHDLRLWEDLATAREGPAGVPQADAPSHIALSPDDVQRIARLYAAIADDLHAAARAHGFIDFSPSCAHIGGANVACDGI